MESIDALVVSMLSLCFYSKSGVGRSRLAGGGRERTLDYFSRYESDYLYE